MYMSLYIGIQWVQDYAMCFNEFIEEGEVARMDMRTTKETIEVRWQEKNLDDPK